MKTILLLLAAAVCCNALPQLQEEWVKFQETYGKSYRSNAEAKKRLAIFSENLKKIESHNARFEKGEVSWKKGVNQFTDQTIDEVNLGLTEYPFGQRINASVGSFSGDIPPSIDWRAKGAVTDVKNSKACAASWIFSTTGALEGLNKIEKGELIPLSEQNLLDCVNKDSAQACTSGRINDQFDYVKKNGIDSAANYPYEGKQGECRQKSSVIKIANLKTVNPTEEDLLQAVANRPVSVGIISSEAIASYSSGIVDSKECNTASGNPKFFAGLAVGYGSEGGKDFWLVKNSLGTNWGEKGYIRIARKGEAKGCGITDHPVYPEF